MKLITRCNSCKKDISIKSNAATRPDLQMEKGDEFKVNCKACGAIEKKHVNDIIAVPNQFFISLGLLIGITASIGLLFIYGVIGSVIALIPITFWYQQMNATRAFNSYRIRRK